MSNDELREALEADGCERIKDFYNVGPVQRAAVESFVAALTATQQAAPSQGGGREMQTPVAWVVRFNDPDPQIDIEFTQECPAGWVGRAEPLYEGPTVRNIELLHRAQRAEAQLAAILEASTQREQPAASKQEPQAQAEPDWKLHQFQSKDGEWHNFVNERHYEATVRHGDWPIRELITLQANLEAIAEAVRVVQDDWELDVRQHREAIAKKDAALDACVEALHESKQNILASAQGFYEDYGTTKQTLDDFQDKQLIAEIDAAITQAKEARK